MIGNVGKRCGMSGEDQGRHGLSGGETFLVSVSLALGLAPLSTRVTPARTLFIEEGFGTLDRDTLENPMVALAGARERLRAHSATASGGRFGQARPDPAPYTRASDRSWSRFVTPPSRRTR